ncbi:aldehyde dehydrogenase family protein [Paenactinomyces guangxiensis]|uniref:Aldehyde dehydrogenase n=1 Tax=Paenactinomyces guangxiensis TaxID=1490290 RepID=A0A7W2A6S8_9BACL|nr:aldehyde dehydrogenase family protein [Paenactinomyces guangxiensis]MBA4492845.1 aldehyde dehydrogenase family protein [Paenactinomyces guangxiensis]MBH8590306.1 aldehyde dehydrogenase family protein [Paenactinomyces guangxiensis]
MGYIDILNPSTGEMIGSMEEKTKEEVTLAMEQARAAFPSWKELSLSKRLDYMKQLREYLVEHADELVEKIASDTGKVHIEALMSEIFATVDFIRYYEKNADSILKPKKVPTPLVLYGRHSEVQYRPIGVVAIISPWNNPFQLSLVPAITALTAGNTVLLKPSEITPLTSLLIEEILTTVSFPEGVVQVLHGGKKTGKHLIQSRPDKIFFTGSVATGKKIMAAAAEHLIPVHLELGGKDPMIIFADADLERAANAAVWGAFTNAGQSCMSVERLYVEFSVYGAVISRLKEKAEQLRIGNGANDDVGSMTSPRQFKVVQEHIADAVSKGATLLCGGKQLHDDTLHFEPTVLVDVNHSMKIMQEETLGPVIAIMPFSSEEEAVRLANDSVYGLNCSIWTRDTKKAERISRQMEYGNICINDVMINAANPHLPFGGIKQSGFGRYHGPEGLLSFCHSVSVTHSKNSRAKDLNWYPYEQDQLEAIRKILHTLHGKNKKISPKEIKELYEKLMK